jgi:hypothetical protein
MDTHEVRHFPIPELHFPVPRLAAFICFPQRQTHTTGFLLQDVSKIEQMFISSIW